MEAEIKKKKGSARKMRKWHKWLGLFFSVFLFVFALSGIFLNHRRAISSVDIPRSWLPQKYEYDNWNNGSVRGSFKISPDSILLYGGNGIWLTDSVASHFTSFNKGMKNGADNRITNNIVRNRSGEIFAVTTFNLYRLSDDNSWQNISERVNSRERFSDLEIHEDSLVLLTRSHAFVSVSPFDKFEQIDIKIPDGYDSRVSLFKTIWTLHSGELFGIVGMIFVDILGITTILLCITGVILMFFPKIIKRRKKAKKESAIIRNIWKSSIKWHNKPGAVLIVFLLIVCISGMFLRPPLLISIIRAKNNPVPLSVQTDENTWHDKLRSIRYDDFRNEWILYTSDGFYNMDNLMKVPVKMEKTPPVSVMGLNVMERKDSVTWILGSFSGMYNWNRQSGKITDFFTGKSPERPKKGPPMIMNPISGYSGDFNDDIVFDYSTGAKSKNAFTAMPDVFAKGQMSLWHLSLEAHVGRIYVFLPDIIAAFFVPLSGIFFLIILISGYIVYRKRFKKRRKRNKNMNS